MFEKSISKDADKLICLLYRGYLEKRKSGISKADAKCFGNYDKVHSEYASKWNALDVDETLRELWNNKFIEASGFDGHVCRTTLTDEAIVYMENRFKNGLSDVIDFLAKLKP